MKTQINGSWQVLTENFLSVSASQLESDPALKNERILKISFTRQTPFWEMEYDTEDKPLIQPPKTAEPEEHYQYQQTKEWNELNRRKRIAAKEFFPRHNQIQHGSDFNNGFVPSGTPIATVEIVTQKAKLHFLADCKKVHVFNKIMSMTRQQVYDLGLYYAPELCYGKRMSEVYYALIGLKDLHTPKAHVGGRMWQRHGKGIVADDFLLNYEGNNTAVMKIYVEKAIGLGVVTRGTGGLYLSNGTFLGKNSDEAVVYLSKDQQSYNNIIQAEVNSRGEMPEDDLADEKTEVILKSQFEKNLISAQGTAEYRNEYTMLCLEAEQITGRAIPEDKKGLHNMREWVKQLREKKVKGDVVATSQTHKLNVMVDDLATGDIEELKKIAKNEGVSGWQLFKSAEALREKIQEHREEKQTA